MPALTDGRACGHLACGVTDLAGIAPLRASPALLRLRGGQRRCAPREPVAGRTRPRPSAPMASGRGASPDSLRRVAALHRSASPAAKHREFRAASPPDAPRSAGRPFPVRVVAAAAAAPAPRTPARCTGWNVRRPRRRVRTVWTVAAAAKPEIGRGSCRRPRRRPARDHRIVHRWQGHTSSPGLLRSCRVFATTASRRGTRHGFSAPAAPAQPAVRAGAMNIVAGGAGDHPWRYRLPSLQNSGSSVPGREAPAQQVVRGAAGGRQPLRGRRRRADRAGPRRPPTAPPAGAP
jgi:hypothetical protein